MRIGRPELRACRVGLAALPVQAVLAREMIVRAGGGEPGLALYLGIWLLGSAAAGIVWRGGGGGGESSAGGVRSGPAALRTAPADRVLGAGMLAAASGIALARLLPLTGVMVGEHAGVLPILMLGILVLALPAALTAGSLPLAARGMPPGRAYAAESIGAAAGGLLSTLAFRAGATPIEVLGAAAIALLVTAPRSRRSLACAAAVLLVVLAGLAGRADRALLRACWEERHPGFRMVGAEWTPGRLVIRAAIEGQDWIFVDDEPREAIHEPYGSESIAALVASVAPRAGSACLIGFSAPDVPELLLRRGIPRVVALAADRRDTLLAGGVRGATVRVGDPRFLFRRGVGGEETFDVIALNIGDGASLSANRLVTVEALGQYVARLGPAGTLLVIAPGGGAAVSPESRGWRRSVAAALREHLPRVVAHDGDRFLLAASRLGDNPLLADSLAARYRRGGIAFATYPAERFGLEVARDRLADLGPAQPNRDARPAAFSFALGRWMRLLGAPAGALRTVRWAFIVLAIAAVAVLGLLRRRPQLVLLGSGAAAMAASLTLLLAYQEAVGLLQAWMGVLLGAFFAGTALGAWLGSPAGEDRRRPRWLTLASPAVAIAAGLILSHLPAMSALGATGLFVLLAALLGAACGIWFPIAAAGATMRSAWAMDCIAGAVGGIAFTLWIDQGWMAMAGGIAALLAACSLVRTKINGGKP